VLPFVSNVEYETVAPEAVARAEKDVFARITQLQGVAQAAGVAFDIRVRRGEEPYREIIAEAQARSADLIIARRRGKRGFFANLMVGEMVGKVATHAPCSVLLVPRAGRVWTRRVLAAVDGTRATASVAATAARIAVEAGVPLVVVSVAVRDTPDGRAVAQAAVAAAASTAQALGATVDGRVVAGPAAETIAALATESGADLIVAGRGGPSSHGRFHLGGNAHRIIGIASCPVLVVKP
jgi:nucleotide-binding universal stress UspA family protein